MLRWRFIVVLLVPVLPLQLSLLAQPAEQGRLAPAPVEATARGIVIDAATARPLQRAIVSVSQATVPAGAVLTDQHGAFVIGIPRGGTPQLRVSRPGYAPMLIPARLDAELQIPLTRGATISGRVLTRTGTPAAGAMVLAQRDDSTPASSVRSHASVVADAGGDYRIFGLAPGRYILRVVQSPAPPSVGARTRRLFLEQLRDGSLDYPFKSLSESTIVDVAAGDALEHLDLEQTERRPCAVRVTLDRRIAAGQARLEGRVLGPSGPLDCAEVMLVQAGAMATRIVGTDLSGRFTFGNLAAGTYTLQARSIAHGRHMYGETAQQPGRLLTLRDGDVRDDVVLALPPAHVIAGVVQDEFGEPLENVSVAVFEVRHQDGYDVVQSVEALPSVTDDRGVFRLTLGQSGSYILKAETPRDAAGEPDATLGASLYYPGTSNAAQAERIRLDSGNVDGLQFTMFHQPGAEVSGTAFRSNGQPLEGNVRLVTNKRAGTPIMPPRSARIGANGDFRLTAIMPGDYVIQAQGSGNAGDFGLEYVHAVAGQVTSVTLTTRPRATIEGHLVVEGPQDAPRSVFAVVAVDADPDYLSTSTVPIRLAVNADGSVRGSGLIGSTRFILEGAPPGWYLKALNIEGIEATRVPFDFGATGRAYRNVEVVVSNASGTIAGRAVTGQGSTISDYAVIVFSVDSSDWFGRSNRLRLVRADVDGGFRVTGLPPGDYWVAAARRLDASSLTGGWQQPDALARLMPSAHRVTVTGSQTVNTTIRISE
jgi:hypothetical protein